MVLPSAYTAGIPSGYLLASTTLPPVARDGDRAICPAKSKLLRDIARAGLDIARTGPNAPGSPIEG